MTSTPWPTKTYNRIPATPQSQTETQEFLPRIYGTDAEHESSLRIFNIVGSMWVGLCFRLGFLLKPTLMSRAVVLHSFFRNPPIAGSLWAPPPSLGKSPRSVPGSVGTHPQAPPACQPRISQPPIRREVWIASGSKWVLQIVFSGFPRETKRTPTHFVGLF